MKRKLNIGIDADGVIFDLFRFQIEKGMKHFNKNINEINIEKYDVQDIFDVTRLERQKFWLRYIYEYCMRSKLMDGVVETIKKWKDEGHKVYNITSRVYVTDPGIMGVIFRRMLEKRYEKEGIVFDGIDYCSEKDSAREKMLACHKRQIDVMIEDKVDNVESISKISKVLCFDAGYNRDCTGENIVRVKSFADAYGEVEKFEQELDFKLGDKQYVVNGKLKRLRPEQESELSRYELMDYYKQRKEYYKNLPYDQEEIRIKTRNQKIAHNILVPSFQKFYNPQVINKELIPYQGGLIFVSNHLGSLDQFPLLHAIGNRPMQILMASTLMEMKRGILYEKVTSLVVDRESVRSKYRSLEKSVYIVSNGGNIFIFPEGTRNRDPNKFMLEFGLGPVTISQITGSPIVPLAFNGRFKFRSKDLLVRVGEPMIVRPGENLIEANDRLEESVATMIWENMEDERRIANGEKIQYNTYQENREKILTR